MRTLLILIILAALAWFGYRKYESATAPPAVAPTAPPAAGAPAPDAPATSAGRFSCDGRTRCPQMRSCEEATYFIQHCPNTEMDGNHDGVPCERQWCK